MCELDIFLEGEKIFENATRIVRDENGQNLIASDALGEKKELGNVVIEEIDISSEKLTLSRART